MISALAALGVRSSMLLAAAFAIVTAFAAQASLAATALSPIAANDNRTAAGSWAHGGWTVSLVARRGLWYPDGPGTQGVPIAAFGEERKPLQIPAPLLRVPAGTAVTVHLRNDLDGETLHVHGLSQEGAGDTAIVLRSGESRTISFRRDMPGTYGYWASDKSESIVTRLGRDAELAGAIVIDDPHRVHADRIFVIAQWVNVLKKDGSPNFSYELQTFNGRAWPATERLQYTRGETVRWRVYNASLSSHPLHLHGFSFTRDAAGDGIHDISFAETPEVREVTHLLEPGATLAAHWRADRSGMWMFHCHIASHILKHAPLSAMIAGRSQSGYGLVHAHQPEDSMGGMILAVRISPAPGDVPDQPAAAKHHLALDVVDNTTPHDGALPSGNFMYVLHDEGTLVASSGSLGPPIVLTAGEPASVTVTNHLAEATAVHWHGIEVQRSYDDGATAMDGMSMAAMRSQSGPGIEPGQSFEARFTPPRAGTFMYHTHMDDLWQLLGGLAGPLIVLSPGQHFDSATDHVVMITSSFAHFPRGLQVNGSLQPAPIVVHLGIPQRLRFLNMTAFGTELVVSLDGAPTAMWTPLAKDGIDLDRRLQTARKPIQQITVGETRDFRFTPQSAGRLTVDFFDGTSIAGSIPIEVQP